MHLPFLARYGYHHDELYFLDCGHHLSFGYVDQSPIVPWIARLADFLFGQSLFGLRIFAVLAGAAAVFITGLLVQRLGGRKFAVFAACFSMLIAPNFIRSSIMLCIPVFEPIIWVSCAYFVVRIIQENNLRLWIWIGVLIGIGLMIKHSTLLLIFGLGIGILLTPLRNHLRTRWPYLAGAIALCIFLPNILWQIANDWPTVEFLRNLNRHTMSRISIFQFVLGQILYLNPVTAPIWIGGLVFFFSKAGKPYRIFGWVYISLFVLLMLIKSKIYYLAPAYPAVLAGGGTALEQFIIRKNWPRLKPVIAGTMILALILFAPILLPITSIDAMDRYCKVLSFGSFENVYEITGDLHGQFGWKERVEAVAKVYHTLSPTECDSTLIFGSWYGPTGAINYFGGEYGLPKAVSGHMTYYLWGFPQKPITTVIVADAPIEKLKTMFDDVIIASQTTLKNVNPWEQQFYVAICRKPKVGLHELWPKLKNW
ncbi:MAG: glycosyltransferase family 39 protein [Bacteroidota bacterium]